MLRLKAVRAGNILTTQSTTPNPTRASSPRRWRSSRRARTWTPSSCGPRLAADGFGCRSVCARGAVFASSAHSVFLPRARIVFCLLGNRSARVAAGMRRRRGTAAATTPRWRTHLIAPPPTSHTNNNETTTTKVARGRAIIPANKRHLELEPTIIGAPSAPASLPPSLRCIDPPRRPSLCCACCSAPPPPPPPPRRWGCLRIRLEGRGAGGGRRPENSKTIRTQRFEKGRETDPTLDYARGCRWGLALPMPPSVLR